MDLGPQLGIATAIVAAVFAGVAMMLRELRKMRAVVAPPKKKSIPPPGSADITAIVKRLEEAVASQDFATKEDLDRFKSDVDRRFESQGGILREIEVCVRRLEGRMDRR
jgi:hypothetical protein